MCAMCASSLLFKDAHICVDRAYKRYIEETLPLYSDFSTRDTRSKRYPSLGRQQQCRAAGTSLWFDGLHGARLRRMVTNALLGSVRWSNVQFLVWYRGPANGVLIGINGSCSYERLTFIIRLGVSSVFLCLEFECLFHWEDDFISGLPQRQLNSFFHHKDNAGFP